MFGPSSKFFQALDAVTDLVLVNLLFVLCAFPLVTLGAASRGLQAALRALASERGDASVWRVFFSEGVRGWRWSTPWGLVCVVLSGLALLDWLWLSTVSGGFVVSVLRAGVIAGVLVFLPVSLAFMSLQVDGVASFGGCLHRAVVLSLRLGWQSVFCALTGLAPLFFLILFPQHWTVVGLYFVLFGFALPAYLFELFRAQATKK